MGSLTPIHLQEEGEMGEGFMVRWIEIQRLAVTLLSQVAATERPVHDPAEAEEIRLRRWSQAIKHGGSQCFFSGIGEGARRFERVGGNLHRQCVGFRLAGRSSQLF